jgi:glutaminyl-peptide cyclotransferase
MVRRRVVVIAVAAAFVALVAFLLRDAIAASATAAQSGEATPLAAASPPVSSRAAADRALIAELVCPIDADLDARAADAGADVGGRAGDGGPAALRCLVQELAAPTKARSADVERWIRHVATHFLSFGPRVAGALATQQRGGGTRRALKFLRRALACIAAAVPGWTLREDAFEQNTVVGLRRFTNFVLVANDACPADHSHIVLAAHWDSKLFPDFSFVGACDSAVSVVMLLRFARQLAAVATTLSRATQQPGNNGSGSSSSSSASSGEGSAACISALPRVSLMFFDGEEAFVDWSGDDNTYGSRHLAAVYERERRIQYISLFVLLDLLGPARPRLHDYFAATAPASGAAFARARAIEARHRADGQRRVADPAAFFVAPGRGNPPGGIDDDHRPWMQRGVPILHLIPTPFPPQWHTAADTAAGIDFSATVVDLYNIIAELALTFHA